MKAEELLNAIGEIEDTFLQEGSENRPSRFSWKRTLALAAAVLLMLSGTLTALAYTNEDVNLLLYRLWPWAAQAMKPVNLVCEDQGIRMEVISAAVEGNRALAYIAMQDLTGDRLDDTTDLFDSARWLLPYDGSGTCQRVAYDADSRTATFLVGMTFDTQRITGGKVTFCVRKLISDKQTQQVDVTPLIDWDRALRPTQGTAQPERNVGGGGYTQIHPEQELAPRTVSQLLAQTPILSKEQRQSAEIVPGLLLEDYGVIDGVLHLRVRALDNLHTDNHLFFTLTDGAGDEITGGHTVRDKKGEPALSVSNLSWIDQSAQVVEYMFDLADADLSGLRLWADCVTAGIALQGDWRVTFPLE